MPIKSFDPRENHLLKELLQPELDALAPHLELVLLSQAEVLYEINEKIEFIYFPLNALVSLQSSLEDGSTVEIQMVGKEGFLDISIILNKNMAFSQAVVSHAGYAYKVSARVLKELLARSGGRRGGMLKSLMLEYAQTFLVHVSQISVCNCRHTLEQRLSRWLLLTFERLESSSLSITHETIGYLLGVRRESITELARKFQLNGILDYRRGHMELKNKLLLEHKACECYKTIRQGLYMGKSESKKVA